MPGKECRLSMGNALFMPWKWNRWTLCGSPILVFALYLLTYFPVYVVLVDSVPYKYFPIIDGFYLPANACFRQSPLLRAISIQEINLMQAVVSYPSDLHAYFVQSGIMTASPPQSD